MVGLSCHGVRVASALVLGACLLAGCSSKPAQPTMDDPKGFVRFEKSHVPKWITPDGVRLKVRRVDNDPRGDLPFWMDAMARHLDQRGYVRLPATLGKDATPPRPRLEREGDVTEAKVAAPRCFDTVAGLRGCQATWLVPRQGEDWVMTVAVYVRGDDIYLVEGAGPWQAWRPRHDDVSAALRSFRPPARER